LCTHNPGSRIRNAAHHQQRGWILAARQVYQRNCVREATWLRIAAPHCDSNAKQKFVVKAEQLSDICLSFLQSAVKRDTDYIRAWITLGGNNATCQRLLGFETSKDSQTIPVAQTRSMKKGHCCLQHPMQWCSKFHVTSITTPMNIHPKPTQGLSLSPILAAFQNSPLNPVFSDMRRGALDLMYVQVHMVSSTTVRKALKSKSADIAERNSPTGRGLDQSQIALLCWSS